jgi:hypothetical protein
VAEDHGLIILKSMGKRRIDRPTSNPVGRTRAVYLLETHRSTLATCARADGSAVCLIYFVVQDLTEVGRISWIVPARGLVVNGVMSRPEIGFDSSLPIGALVEMIRPGGAPCLATDTPDYVAPEYWLWRCEK